MRQATPTLPIPDGNFSFYNVTKGVSGTGGPNDVIRVTVRLPLECIHAAAAALFQQWANYFASFFNNEERTLFLTIPDSRSDP